MQAAIGSNPTTTVALPSAPVAEKTGVSASDTDPQNRAALSAEYEHWTLHPPDDVRRMVARAIRELGRNKAFWVAECIRAGLAPFAGKKDRQPSLLEPTSFKK